MEEEKMKDYLRFQLNRNIISLYKKYFEMMEDLRKDHLCLLEKVKENTSEEFVDRKSTRLNSSHSQQSRMPSSA